MKTHRSAVTTAITTSKIHKCIFVTILATLQDVRTQNFTDTNLKMCYHFHSSFHSTVWQGYENTEA